MRPRNRYFLAILGRESRGVVASLFAFGLLAAALLACAAPAAAQNTVPDAELNVKAEPGDEKVSLHFKEPDDGGSPITRYEYRVKVATGSYPATWTRVPEFTGNVGATLDLFVVVESLAGGTALANGTEYAFQVRAVNGVGAGMPDEDMATPQANVPARYTLGPERGIIERRPLAPAPRVPADQHVSLIGAIIDTDLQSVADEGDGRFTYEWEWIRVRAGSETAIAGAGAGDRGERTTEYVLTPADVGSQIKARVRYRDDRYNEEEFVTALFPASGTILPAAACAAPTYTGGAAEIWQDELKIEDIDHALPTPNRYGVFGSRMFTAGSNTYEIDGIYRETVGADADKLSFGLTADLTETDKNQLILYVCDEAYPLIDATLLPTRHNYLWPDTDDWSTYLTRTVRLGRDAVAPTVTRARISGASLTVAFSEDLDGGSIPATAAFAVEVGGEPAELETGSTVVLGGDRVTLTLAEAPSSGSTITLDYSQPGTGKLRDPARNDVADFTATATEPAPPPVVSRGNPPGAPRTLVATPGDSQVVLVWKAPASSGGRRVTRYEARHAEGTSVPAGTPWESAGLELEWTVADLTNGQQYAFEVRAVNSAGAGPAATATATPLGELLAPESLSAAGGDARVMLSWSEPADDGGAPVTGYEVRHMQGGSVPPDTPWQSAGLELEWTVADLTNGQQYAFEVRAVNSAGAGPAATATATPLGELLAPESLSAAGGDARVMLSWSEPADDGGAPVTGYEVRHMQGGSVPPDTPWQSAGLELEWTVADLTNGQQYAFEVRAVNSAGAGPAATATATPLGELLAPESLSAAGGDARVMLSWSEPADDGGAPVTGYEVRHVQGGSVPPDTPWQSAGLELEWTVADLTNGQQYAFEVRAVNVAGPGAAATATATPLGELLAPESLSAAGGDARVMLSWSEPADDGGAPVTGYEVRHAQGGSVPPDTPWQSAGLELEWTVADLTNGQQYAFEVRAVNVAGPGAVATATATPLSVPLAPESLTALAGDAVVELAWNAPADDGGAPILRYEYRFAAEDTAPGDTSWLDVGGEFEATVTGLQNEVRYVFEVRAVNIVGPGEAASKAARPIRLRVALFADEAAAEGEPLVLGVRRSGGLAYAAHAYVGVTDSAVPGVTAMDMGRGDGLGRHRLELAAGEAESTFTIAPEFDGVRAAERTLTVTLESAEVEIDGRRLTYEPEVPTLELAVMDGDAAVSVADARAEPGATTLRFRVSLDRTRDVPILVDYATADGTARAGQDYTAVSGALTLEPGPARGRGESARAGRSAPDGRAHAEADAFQSPQRADRRRRSDRHHRQSLGRAAGMAGTVRAHGLGPVRAGDTAAA